MKDEPGAQFAEMAVLFEYTKAGKLVRSMLPVSHEGYCKITSFFVVGGILSILMWSDRVGFQRKPQNGSQMHINAQLEQRAAAYGNSSGRISAHHYLYTSFL